MKTFLTCVSIQQSLTMVGPASLSPSYSVIPDPDPTPGSAGFQPALGIQNFLQARCLRSQLNQDPDLLDSGLHHNEQ
jgi:hypothetical protein